MSNAEKQQHGSSAQNGIEALLNSAKGMDLIVEYKKNYRNGYLEYGNKKQFYAPFAIQFCNGEKWILYSTTSARTDRIKGNLWDAYHLKKIDSSISMALLVYADSLSVKLKKEFITQDAKYQERKEYTSIDKIVSQNVLFKMIEKKALADQNAGFVNDKRGINFEMLVASVLSHEDNLKKWKTDDVNIEGLHYDLFLNIINELGLEKQQCERIEATSDKKVIGFLPSGGSPKTDVLVWITFLNQTIRTITISCKRSNVGYVTVHQYSAEAFGEVLNPFDEQLIYYLSLFQANPTLRDFGEENGVAFTQVLAKYLEKLCLWVMGGFGGLGSPQQKADYILLYDDNAVSFEPVKKYCNYLINNVSGHFGTPFSWTYASGSRGKSIQLKIKT